MTCRSYRHLPGLKGNETSEQVTHLMVSSWDTRLGLTAWPFITASHSPSTMAAHGFIHSLKKHPGLAASAAGPQSPDVPRHHGRSSSACSVAPGSRGPG